MSPASSTPVLHRCNICFKTYKRREHLQRHKSSHTSERPHRCVLCNASFQRTDVLKRHLQTCDGASNPSGGRRRACDRCVRQKKACSSSQPCENCTKRGVECLYTNATPSNQTNQLESVSKDLTEIRPAVEQYQPSHEDGSFDKNPVHFDPDLDALIQDAVSEFPLFIHDGTIPELSSDWLHVGTEFSGSMSLDDSSRPEPSCSSSSDYHGYSFNFLYDFTSRTGLVSSFECGTLSQRLQVLSSFHYPYSESDTRSTVADFRVFESLDDPGLLHDDTLLGHDVHISAWSPWLSDPVVPKLEEILSLVKQVVTVKPNNSSVSLTWSATLEQKCLRFFSPPRFARFIELYWSVWHPNVNIVHRPSFDVSNTKSILLAGMALIGACMSPDPVDREDAKTWFNCVEEMVFTDDAFCSDNESSSPIDETQIPPNVLAVRPKLQALQASYMVCLYQNWEGTDAGKRRIRRHRFSTVVSVARDMDITIARRPDYSLQTIHEFQWADFVTREELIRTFLWIFLLDAAFVIFNNIPHRIVIGELRTHMASPEACFQALTPEECLQECHRWIPPSSPFCSLLLRDAIESVCIDHLEPTTHQKLSQLGPLNLFAIVSAFHYMIFHHQNLFSVEGQLVPIRNGLRNWIAIWELYFDTWSSLPPHGMAREDALSPDTMWKRVGFIRYSPEYWLLGSVLTVRIASLASRSRGKFDKNKAIHETPDNSASSLSTTLLQSVTLRPILEKYDQTSMRQVNDLITDFQKFQIEEQR